MGNCLVPKGSRFRRSELMIGKNFLEMVEKNSGKVYGFKLDHNFGFGFAEVYDFTDVSNFSGRLIFVYNLIADDLNANLSIDEISKSGIALGPITLWKFPNSRGKGAWKLIGKMDHFLIDIYPPAKDVRANPFLYNNWSKFDRWFIDSEVNDPLEYVPYEQVRRMETRVLNPKEGVAKKFTMKHIIDTGLNVSDYYDLSDLGNRNMYVDLVNTYYPDDQVEVLVRNLPILVPRSAK